MRIGVDLDDTVCRTTEMVHLMLGEYSSQLGIGDLDIMNDEALKEEFFSIYSDKIYQNAEIKRNAAEVLKRLRSRGNEIYLITSRSGDRRKVFSIIDEWLSQHDIFVDAIFISVSSEERGLVCRRNKIDLMIDNNPYNYKHVTSCGIKCLLFDDREKYVLKENYVSNWLEIEKYIERNR